MPSGPDLRARPPTDEELAKLIVSFDSGRKGFWSAENLNDACTEVLRLPPGRAALPRGFRPKAVDVLKSLLAPGDGEAVEESADDRLTPAQLRGGFVPFLLTCRTHVRRWAAARSQLLFACPTCAGCFRLRLDPAGRDVAALAATRLRDDRNPKTSRAMAELRMPGPLAVPREAARPLLSPEGGLVDLHAELARRVAEGLSVLAVPVGAARPALAAQVLADARRDAGQKCHGALVLVAAKPFLEAAEASLIAALPRRCVQWLTAHMSSAFTNFCAGQIWLTTAVVLRQLLDTGRLNKAKLGLVLFCCGRGELPMVAEVDPSAPLRLVRSGSARGPRVCLFLDDGDPLHAALTAQMRAMYESRGHLHRALNGLQRAVPRKGLGAAGESADGGVEVAMQRLLAEAARFPEAEAVEVVYPEQPFGLPRPPPPPVGGIGVR